MPKPWHRDRVLLIGDAAHATTPQLASGAGMAMEDGVVLGECIAFSPDIDEALALFMQRRFARCAIQNELTAEIVAHMVSYVRASEAEHAAARPPESLQAYDLLLRSREPYKRDLLTP